MVWLLELELWGRARAFAAPSLRRYDRIDSTNLSQVGFARGDVRGRLSESAQAGVVFGSRIVAWRSSRRATRGR